MDSKPAHAADGRSHQAVKHRDVKVDDLTTFYREAGHPDAPVVLLLHGYPCSSYRLVSVPQSPPCARRPLATAGTGLSRIRIQQHT